MVSLDAIVSPEDLRRLPAVERRELLRRATQIAAMLTNLIDEESRALNGADVTRFISVGEAAKILDMSERWVIGRAPQWEFAKRMGKRWKFDELALRRYATSRHRKNL